MNLYIPSKPLKAEFSKKQSKFISYIRFCNSKSEFKSWLSQIRKDHYDGSHICWSYSIIEKEYCEYHSSDSGEPIGTAGRPILNMLKSNNLVQTGLVVVRYFGGIKLGRKGLIKSYQDAAGKVINEKNFIVWVLKKKYTIKCPIEFYNIVISVIKECGGIILKNKTSDLCYLDFEIIQANKEGLFNKIQLYTNKKSTFINI